jgi:hypothetical protein
MLFLIGGLIGAAIPPVKVCFPGRQKVRKFFVGFNDTKAAPLSYDIKRDCL